VDDADLISIPTGTPSPVGGDPNPSSDTGTFCAQGIKKRFEKVVASAANKKLLLPSITGTSLEAAGDRVLFALILYNGLKLDGLINVIVRDYYSVGTVQILNTLGIKQEPKAVQAKVKALVDAYIAAALPSKKGAFPRCQGVQPKTGELSSRALC
jgi:hypothetical protein